MHDTRFFVILSCAIALGLPGAVFADNGTYTGVGGSFSAATTLPGAISVQGVPLAGTTASASFTCPITSFGAGTYQWNWTCSGGSLTITSTDNSIALNGSFAAASMTYSGSGGGRGGHTTYWYQFSGSFSGTTTRNGASQAANGSVSFVLQTGAGSTFSLGWSSAYSPLLVANSSQLFSADDLAGDHRLTYGTWGNGTGQFEAIAGLAHDAGGRIYIADAALDRLVRINGLGGGGWTELGTSGAAALQFSHPLGVAIDAGGKIWVADSGNNRIVRFNDMTGKNWTSFGTAGAGANQFTAPAAIAFDAQNRIYVADAGNNRLVRFDDLKGTNWTTLTTINIDPYGYSLTGVNSVAISPAGKIYVSTPAGWLYRVDDMTAANPQVTLWSPSIAGLSLDPSGTVFVAGGFTPNLALTEDAAGTGHYFGDLGLGTMTPTAILAQRTTSPPPAVPLLSASLLSFGSRNVQEPGPPQSVTVANIGGSPLTVSSITAGPDYPLTSTCAAPVSGGSTCAVSIALDPTTTGSRPSTLSVDFNGIHPLLTVALHGAGTAPQALVVPTTLSFLPQVSGTVSGAQTVTLSNPGTGPLTISSIVPGGDFAQTNNCPSILTPGKGCTLSITFTPAALGLRTGSITLSDDAVPGGTTQSVVATGTGVSATPALTLLPESLFFPSQQLNVASNAQTMTLKNTTKAAISLGAPSLSPGFSATTTCGASLAAGASCTFSVKFTPTNTGPLAGSLSITPGTGTAITAGLSGTGTQSLSPALRFNPPSAAFGAIQTGDNPDINLTVTNGSGVPSGIRSKVLTGSHAFSKTSDNCPAILAGGASCTVQITLKANAVAIYSGTLTFTESSGAVTAIPLSGSATVNGN